MSDALNPNQVEALQQAITAGGMSTADGNIFSLDRDPAASVPILQYDFKRPERISKDQIRSLKTLHESFARNVGSQWTGLMRAIVEVDIVQVEQMTYAEYTAGLSNPTCFGLVRPDTLDGTVCLELSPQIFFAIVDRLMGGGGATTYNPERPLTLIETRLARSVLLRAMQPLSDAWSTVRPVRFSLEEIESNPLIMQVVPPNEVVIAFEFNVRSSGFSGTMTLCVPFTVIEPLVDELGRRSWAFASGDGIDEERSRQASNSMSRHIGKAGVEVTATLAETTMTLSELQALEVGDVILTGSPADTPSALSVEGQLKFNVIPGTHRGSRVVRVIDPTKADKSV